MKNYLMIFILTLLSMPALAKFSYEGFLTDVNGIPVASQNIVVKLQLSTVTGACLIYDEYHNTSTDAEGYFSVVVGGGTAIATHTTGLTFDDLFSNGSLISATSPTCSATPSVGESRSLAVYVGTGTYPAASYDSLGSISVYPTQLSATAEKIAKHTVNSLLRVESSGTPATAPIITPTDATEFVSLLAGASAKYLKTGSGGAGALPTSSGSTAGSIWYDTTTNTVMYHNGSAAVALGASGSGGGGVSSVTANLPISVASPTTTPVLSMSQAGTSTNGYLSSADWNIFNGKLGSGLVSAQIWVGNGSNQAQAVPVTGDANLSSAGVLTVNAVPTNTASTIVRRDGSGNFIAGQGTFETAVGIKDGSGGGTVTISPATATGSYGLTLPSNQAAYGQTLINDGAGLLSWQNTGDFFSSGSTPMTGQFKAYAGSASNPGIAFTGYSGTGLFSPISNEIAISITGVEQLRVTSGGNVGIGTTTPGFRLQVNGDIAPGVDATSNLGAPSFRFNNVYAANGTINTSDLRMKRGIQSSDLGLDFINELTPVSYYWKKGDSHLHYGLIAQDTETAILNSKMKSGRTHEAHDSIVDYDESSDSYGIRYTELISPVIKAIQELYQKYLAQDDEVARLKNENAQIKAYLCEKDRSAIFCESRN